MCYLLSLLLLLFFSQCTSSQSNTTYLSIGIYANINNNNNSQCLENNFQFGMISLQSGYCVSNYLPFNNIFEDAPLFMYLDEYNHIYHCKTKYCGIITLPFFFKSYKCNLIYNKSFNLLNLIHQF